jgi:pyrroloquinoline quinone biosynthesis protein B
VFEWVFRSNPIFDALVEPSRFTWHRVGHRQADRIRDRHDGDTGLVYEAFFVPGKVPTFVRPAPVDSEGSTTAYKISDPATGKSVCYVPCIKQLSAAIVEVMRMCDCVFLDGTFWSEDEMTARGAGEQTASQMGHLPIGGAEGSLARLRGLDGIRKIYTHVNNTNPVLDGASPERRTLDEAGWDVAEDGMDIDV